MPLLILQRGHVPRTTGATGTEGEQVMTLSVAALVKAHIPPGWTLRIVDADEPDERYRGGDAFVAVHGDGSTNRTIRGASVGYRNAQGSALAQRWKTAYDAAGWPGGWHNDNYTTGLAGYYGVREAVSNGTPNAFILEVGMMTNPQDRAWIDAHHAVIAATIWEAVAGVQQPSQGGDSVKLLDPVPAGWQRFYRLWSATEHHYTTDIAEANALIAAGWRFEDRAWDVSLTDTTNTLPLYRILRANGKHFLTTSIAEKDAQIAAGGKSEGIVAEVGIHGVPVYRFENNGGHFYTTNQAEGAGMKPNGVAWYCGHAAPVVSTDNQERIAALEAQLDKAHALFAEGVTVTQ